MRNLLITFFVLAGSVLAQPFSFGVKVGTPLNNLTSGCCSRSNFDVSTTRFLIGPTAEIRLPFGLGVEADLLYHRYQLGNTVNQWSIPILAKYRAKGFIAHPFVDAGVAFNHVGDIGFATVRDNSRTTGFVLGGGIEVRALLLRLSPELRYTRWRDPNLDLGSLNGNLRSNQNQLDFMVGFSF